MVNGVCTGWMRIVHNGERLGLKKRWCRGSARVATETFPGDVRRTSCCEQLGRLDRTGSTLLVLILL